MGAASNGGRFEYRGRRPTAFTHQPAPSTDRWPWGALRLPRATWIIQNCCTIRKTRRCHTPTWRRAQNAALLNGVGYDGDNNDASCDAFNHNLWTLMLPGRRLPGIVYFKAPANDGSARPLCLRAPPVSDRL